jgi:hypothetical protein
MRKNTAKPIALGGVLAALAVVIMCMGGMIPIATFVCPMACMLILKVVHQLCGNSVAWGWYGAVAILSLLMSPDKEAAAVFVFLGFYPILKPRFDRRKLAVFWKGIFFNAAILMMYYLLIFLLDLDEVAQGYLELGAIMTLVMLVMGNICFFMLDKILSKDLLRK